MKDHKKIVVSDIEWDADTKEELEGVSDSVTLYISNVEFEKIDDIEEYISDKITDASSFCHKGWKSHTITDVTLNNRDKYINYNDNNNEDITLNDR